MKKKKSKFSTTILKPELFFLNFKTQLGDFFNTFSFIFTYEEKKGLNQICKIILTQIIDSTSKIYGWDDEFL